MPDFSQRDSHLSKRAAMAEILSEVYEVATERFGQQVAKDLIAESVRRSAIKEGHDFARETETTGLTALAQVLPRWSQGGALEIDLLRSDDVALNFNVTRCRYAEMYKSMDLAQIGGILSCQRDATFCQGLDPKIRLIRTQTIMGGADHCDFRFAIEAETP